MTPEPTTAPRPVSGKQYVIRRGDAQAKIGQVAAVLREYTVGGTHYTETWPDDQPTPMGCGIVLMPWPNRVAGATWNWRGAEQLLDVTERAYGNAIHGLLRDIPYRVADLEESRVTLAASIYPQHGWPFTLDTTVAYELTDTGLAVTHTVANVGATEAVFGCGAHPYLRIGEVPVDELDATVRAARYFVTNGAMIPIEKQPLDGTVAGLPTGARVGDLNLDTGFADLEPAQSGRFEHRLRAPDGRTLTIWADADFQYTVVFTPDGFPNDTSRGPAGTHRAIAIEPMTCPTNALNSGEGLITLRPGESWQASWGLTPS